MDSQTSGGVGYQGQLLEDTHDDRPVTDDRACKHDPTTLSLPTVTATQPADERITSATLAAHPHPVTDTS